LRGRMNPTTAGRSSSLPGRSLWQAAQWLGIVTTGVLVGALWFEPDFALAALWNVAIPLLPATFLISPAFWRNVCPLATLNMMTNRSGPVRLPRGKLVPSARIAGMALLLLLVPARRFLFNTNGIALAVVIVAVALLALALGAAYSMKSGFCNAICPVLPVERLYGQSPLMSVGNPRCIECSSCTARGCIDLGATKAVPQALGRARRSNAWLRTDFGVFAAAFPGFVLGYNLTQDGPLSSALAVYTTVIGWAAASYVITFVFVHVLRFTAAESMRLLAVAAVGTYYWFAAPVVTDALRLPAWAPATIRTVAFALVGVWLAVATLRQAGEAARKGVATAA